MSLLIEVHVHSTQLETALETLAMLPFEVNPNLHGDGSRTTIEFFVTDPEHAEKVQRSLLAGGVTEPRVALHDVALI